MKKCSRCKDNKNLSEFRTSKSSKDGYQKCCIVCDKEYQKEWYKKNKAKVIPKSKIRNIQQAKKIQDIILGRLEGNSCAICGEKDILVLEFDHLENKKFDLGKAFYKNEKEVENELNKCQILCSNCHKRKTHKERKTYRWTYSQAVRHDSAKV